LFLCKISPWPIFVEFIRVSVRKFRNFYVVLSLFVISIVCFGGLYYARGCQKLETVDAI